MWSLVALLACFLLCGALSILARPALPWAVLKTSPGKGERGQRSQIFGSFLGGTFLRKLRARGGKGQSEAREAGRVLTALDQLASLACAGLAPVASCVKVGEELAQKEGAESSFLGGCLEGLGAAEQWGQPIPSYLERFAAQAPTPLGSEILESLAVLWRLSERTGVSLAPLLESLAEQMHQRIDAREAAEAAMAVPKSTARLLLWLPMIGAGFSVMVMGQRWAETLFSLPGLVLMCSAGLLMIVGRLWMRGLMKSATTVKVRW